MLTGSDSPTASNTQVAVNGDTHLHLLRTPTRADLAAVEAEEQAERMAAIKASAGFSAVMEAIRSCGRPAVGHNCLYDVMYMLSSFVQPCLPTQW